MRTTTACTAAILAAALLTSCSTGKSSSAAAAEKVQGICEDLKVHSDGTDAWNNGGDSMNDWTSMARLQNNVANQAASAAVTDPRWNRLADTLSDMAAIAQRYADANPVPIELTPEDSAAVSESGLIVHAECRKAFTST
ncbi:hypothetical protein [Streptomyces sp. NPDC058108]|uniref:hypothetical protein n=1 Tax=Streptomyces sp. NPDC058108 TaxID=3346344 RepID=UPI0036F05C22